MELTIEYAKVKDFGGSRDFAVHFNDSVNVIIGRNGSGKTRFINLLQGVLSANPFSLYTIEFSEVEILLTSKNDKQRRKILVSREYSDDDVVINYKIGTRIFRFVIPLRVLDIDSMSSAMRRRIFLGAEAVKLELDNIINVSSISVGRDIFKRLDEEPIDRISRKNFSVIDTKLSDLLNQLKSYQLELASQASEESLKFQQDVLSLMLWDEKFDSIREFDYGEVSIEEQREGLKKAYKDLGAYSNVIQKKIDKHIDAIKKASENMRGNKSDGITIDDLMPLPLLRRTKQILEISNSTDERRRDIFSPITDFIKILGKYFDDKNVSISREGQLIILVDGKQIQYLDLSSGEKQILIVLTESLLKRQRTNVFFADEPELSLHVKWQASIIADMKSLNPNGQIIIATHSPEISARRTGELINMWKLVSNG